MTACDVLVIDDEPVVRDAVQRVLEANGLRVATADDAASGLAHAGLAVCRLVLCDLMLPDRSGFEVVEEVARRRPGVPVLVITGYATAEHAARAQQAGAAGFLAKPFEARELMDAVRGALAGQSAKEEGP
ncbi:MAG TPA: response regulator [Candidatus Dormibacteraeota bacterium]|nr:response regulator [Candidatus Dormibacteraeota bacterium]